MNDNIHGEKMKIPEISALNLVRTESAHQENGVLSLGKTSSFENSAKNSIKKTRRSFDEYLMEAFKNMNQNQVDVEHLQEKVITDPESVDIHDVTIAMSKAKMSLNLAKTVIDRLVQGWSEITTTR